MPSTSSASAVEPAEPVPPDAAPSPPSSPSLGGKVARGGLWTMGGEVARFVVAMVATSFVTRLLGEQVYGVWSLIVRLSSALSFTDAGVGVASTKYVSEAHARHDPDGERRALWASLLVGLVPSLGCALLVLALAPWVVHRFFASNVPPQLHGPMTVGLQVSAFAFAVRTVTAVFNSPLLARLRLDLNTLIFYGSIVAQLALTPVALALGGIAWGAAVPTIAWVITGAVYVAITARLLPGSLSPVLDRELLKPIARMGAGTLVTALAAQVLYSADAFIVGALLSAEAAGYYNIAFQASNVLTILPGALTPALMPAFSRLLARGESRELQSMVRRAMRAGCLVLPPALALMCAAARPFFFAWAGPSYALYSTPAFFGLAVGLALNVLMTIPYTLLLALGRTGATARVGLFEVLPFVLYTWGLTSWHGILGAAAGRSLRFALASAIIFPLASRMGQVSFSPRLKAAPFALALCGVAVPIALALWPGVPAAATIGAAVVGVGLYGAIVWSLVLEPGERDLVARQAARVRGKFKR